MNRNHGRQIRSAGRLSRKSQGLGSPAANAAQRMLLLNEGEVASLLTMPQAITLMEEAFRAQAQGSARFPLRTMAQTKLGILGAMPGAIEASSHAAFGGALGAKLVTAFPKNSENNKPSHQALIILFDADTGEPLALIDGRYITEVRTAATSALATRFLAPPGASVLAIIGTGVQARAHIDAMQYVMQMRELRVWGRTPQHATSLVNRARESNLPARATATVPEATRGAHVICTVTGAREPLLHAKDVGAGTHINAVGFWPNGRELSSDLMKRSRIIVDSEASALSEAGDVMLAIKDGALSKEPQLTPLCSVVAGGIRAGRAKDDITVFESVGIAIEDLACAAYVYERARELGKGAHIAV